jgi:hypothetical protein
MEDEKKKIIALKKPASEEKIPDIYINQVKFFTSLYEFLFQFGLKSDPDKDPEPLVNIRMSPQHAKVMVALLRKNVKAYEKNIGEIKLVPQMIKDLGIEEEI